jgi:hypothetical protein
MGENVQPTREPIASGRRTRRGRLLSAVTVLATVAAVLVVGAAPAYAGPVAPVSGNYYYLLAADMPNPTMCMDVRNASANPGGYLQLWDCGVQWNQQFKFERLRAGNNQDVWRMRLRYAPSLCVAVDQGPLPDPSWARPMVTEPCSNGWEQLFLLGTSADGSMFLPLYENGMCMSHDYDHYAPSTTRGFQLKNQPCGFTDDGFAYDPHWEVWNSPPPVSVS